jgi:hypothetical protein
LEAASYPTSIGGEQSKSSKHSLSFQYGKLSCDAVDFSSPSIFSPKEQFSVEAAYSGNCKLGGLTTAVNMNGCSYTFNVLNQAPVGGAYAGHADIACPAGKSIEVVTVPQAKRCTITIAAQTTDSGGLTFTNDAVTPTILATFGINGIDYHQQKGEGIGSCTTGDYTTGTYTGASTLFGVL